MVAATCWAMSVFLLKDIIGRRGVHRLRVVDILSSHFHQFCLMQLLVFFYYFQGMEVPDCSTKTRQFVTFTIQDPAKRPLDLSVLHLLLGLH